MKSSIAILFMLQLVSPDICSQPSENGESVTNVMNFDWMPDGKGICFAAIRSDKARKKPPVTGIFLYNLQSRQVTQVVKNGHSPGISPDGEKMAYTKTAGGLMGNNDIYVYDFNSKTEFEIASDTLLREGSPCWSGDGTSIVYTAMKRSANGIPSANLDIWVVELSTRLKRQITQSNGFRNYNPVWAPEGNMILYYLEKGDSRDQIYLTDSEGRFHINLTSDTTSHNYYPSWYGNQVIYTQSPNAIMVMDTNGRNRSLIEGLNAFWARYNPGSKKIAFLTPGSRDNPPDFKIFDPGTRSSTLIFSRALLNGLDF